MTGNASEPGQAPTATAWVGRTAAGTVVARPHVDGEHLAVDHPGAGVFRQSYPMTVRNGAAEVDGDLLAPMVGMSPTITGAVGWYGDDDPILLTQFAEAYFGEPMVLLAEGDRVQRAYPLADAELVADDATRVEVLADSLRLTTAPTVRTLPRSRRLRERLVTFTSGDVRLAGTLIVPAGPGPHPAAVLVQGAAGGQRDFCRLFAGPILAAGVAVLIYDKPGHGLSGGSPDPSIFDQAEAASAGVDLLAAMPEIDAEGVGLAGFSNGMWSVPQIAARRGDIAFVVGIGSPGVSMGESEVHRRTKVLRDAGVGEASVAAAAQAWRSMFSVAAAGPTPSVVTQLGEAMTALEAAPDLARYEIPDFVREQPMLSPIPPLVPVTELLNMIGDSRDPELGHDPAADYRRLRCPVFLQYGADDTSVPVGISQQRLRAALTAAGVAFTIAVHPGLEHMLNVPPTDLTGLSGEEVNYLFHGFRFGAGVRDELAAWLRRWRDARPG